jgi:cytochrome b6-f complex iron-sulfur subunit
MVDTVKKNKKIQKTDIQPPHEPTRRTFFNKLWMGLGILAFIEFLVLVLAYLRPGRSRVGTDTAAVIEAGPVEKFVPHSVTAFVRGRFYLCRLEDGGFLAVSRKCTHLGCTVPWLDKEKRFICPCHASVYDIRGEVISPPAPRPLDIYPVTIENNIVKVDTQRPIKRSAFRATQVVYAKEAGK